MTRIIEAIISPQGETTIRTQGYTGGNCFEASKFLEQALGTPVTVAKTAEFYQTQQTQQQEVQQ